MPVVQNEDSTQKTPLTHYLLVTYLGSLVLVIYDDQAMRKVTSFSRDAENYV